MKNCPYCQEEISQEARFCNHCGKDLSDQGVVENKGQEEPSEQNVQEDVSPEQEIGEIEPTSSTEEPDETPAEAVVPSTKQQAVTPQAKPKGKNKNKLYGIIIAIIAVLAIGLYMVGDSLTSPDKVIESFQKAVEDGDVNALKDMLESSDDDMEITEEGIEGFISLYQSEPRELRAVVRGLRDELRGSSIDYNFYPVSIEKDGKKWLFFDDYKLVILPVYFNVYTNYEGTTIYVGDEEVATADDDYFEKEIGPFMPGEYTIRGVLDNGFSYLDVEETVVNSDPELTKYVDLYIDASTVYFSFDDYSYYDLQEIRLIINGNETPFNLVEDSIVGPLLTDGSMNAAFEVDFPWGTMRTNEVPIDSTDITVKLTDNEEFKEEIIDVIMQYNTEFVELFTQVKADHLTTVSIELAELLMIEAANQLGSGYEYQAAFHGADFYLDSFYLTNDYSNNWYIEVDGIAYFEEAFYEEGDVGEFEQIEDETRFILGYDQTNEEWIVTGLDYPGWMDEDNMERFVIENPEVFTSVWNEGLETEEDEDEEAEEDEEEEEDEAAGDND